jgi:hypothetical protein
MAKNTHPITGRGAPSACQPHDRNPWTDLNRSVALDQLRIALRQPRPPVPEAALALLYSAACGDTGGSQAARSFLFWLAGRPDPTGYRGSGGLELRRMDREHKTAALELLSWWAGSTQSDQPVYEVLSKLAVQIPDNADTARSRSRQPR